MVFFDFPVNQQQRVLLNAVLVDLFKLLCSRMQEIKKIYFSDGFFLHQLTKGLREMHCIHQSACFVLVTLPS